MADNTSLTLFRGAATTTSTTVYTSPVNMAVCVTNIAITNPNTSSANATINLAGVPLLSGIGISPNTTTFITPDQIIFNTESISASATTTAIRFHISGYEVY
jgi:hypothetical protein